MADKYVDGYQPPAYPDWAPPTLDRDPNAPPELAGLPIFHQPAPPADAHPLATQPPAPEPAGWSPPQVVTSSRRNTPARPQKAAREDAGGVDWSLVDWELVRAYRQLAAERLAGLLDERSTGSADDERRRAEGRRIVSELLESHDDRVMISGDGEAMSLATRAAMQRAIMDSLFGLGRLQPLVDMEDVENIEGYGHDVVWLEFSDGHLEQADDVADSDEELIDMLQFVAARQAGSERPFSPNNPDLHLRLDGGDRLAATAWITPRPNFVIRRHRLRRPDLTDLVERGLMTADAAAFLAAAVKAKKSIVVSGSQGAGKTTLVRALAGEIPPEEKIGTAETEYELHLHELVDRHPRCTAWEARPGSGERGPDGHSAGEITLDDIIYSSFRFNLSRLIVGEVRGKEVMAMFKAMQAGAGSLSTTHAHSARAAIEKLVTCAMEAGRHVTEEFAQRQIAEHIDLIVQIELHTTLDDAGVRHKERYISEIIEIAPGERGRAAAQDVFKRGTDGRLTAGVFPPSLDALKRFGFKPEAHGFAAPLGEGAA